METKATTMALDKRVKVFTKEGEKKVVERMVRERIVELDRVAAAAVDQATHPSSEHVGSEEREKRRRGLKPVMETKSMKRSGMAHQVPTPVNDARGLYRACNWIREATLKRAKKMGVNVGDARRMERRALYEEYQARSTGTSSSANRTTLPLQMRDRTHRAAKANRVFASGR